MTVAPAPSPSSPRPGASWRAKLLLLVGSLTVLALAAELLVRLCFPTDRLEYVADDELLWRFRTSQTGRHELPDGSASIIESVNRAGYRGPEEFDAGDPRPRVLLIGDSYTWGWGVADKETLGAQLAQHSADAWQVVNAGTPGWGVFQFAAALERALPIVRPQVVLVTLVEWDVYRQPYDDPQEQARELARNRWKNRVRQASRLVTVLARMWERLGQQAPAAAVANEQPHSASRFARCWARDRARLTAMHQACTAQGARMLVVGWPQATETSATFRQELAAWAAQRQVAVVDLEPGLATVPRAERTLADGHPNARGYRLAAGAVFPSVAAEIAARVTSDAP